MGCACNKRQRYKYVWTGDDGTTMEYRTEIEAKAKVIRKGGSYEPILISG